MHYTPETKSLFYLTYLGYLFGRFILHTYYPLSHILIMLIMSIFQPNPKICVIINNVYLNI
ncbi:hypothetical protein GLOIN_2v1519002 [Rhizophagus irregularis DAOM 181602=DAOM 197198]|uniref:Uncharacterized protein n=1 Tax=Rhizophagus irregularis (strain DAOM 181602 / DAOM 197198 / MUCL 43194) TaxID=747089 RepID=A0A2P4QR89_RHIID|nr:hypothetical protein GLOIN_2v1519002 [Rhizophagus irregularis DAOM 181602=DAOM 197198]POG80166.1 hypothetical protein GLOIN_2v1519002 [Rhizophagus irregularis DAOM 181602=DAOM 197198]|eukprot:XP_025187032.1 hypothetical protein GLOIN_2v1519002 [Rhizophagus irregularis DAOM 181602=DAOM 197198]